MLYHVPDRPKAIGEIKRVLKPAGRLFATTIGKNHLKEMADWLRQVSIGNTFESFGSPFTLDNGLEQLQQSFSHVTISRYPDNLRVTEFKPILAFIRSTTYAKELSEEGLIHLQQDLERQLASKGEIFITKDSGLFEAIK
jgi:ubiquinone/menaquinone biosynthesis C-methylase UbiE